MVSFADLKKNRTAKFDELVTAVTKKASFTNYDDKCWKPTIDKSGVGYARIRFLSAPTFLGENERDFAKVESFNTKRFVDGKARYYIENSLTTVGADGKKIGENDPANDLKWALWNLGDKENQDLSRSLKNRTQYYANVYIIEDHAMPQNVGKVMPYKFGNQIFEKIENSLTPKFPNDPVFNPFDMWEGRDFIVKASIDPKSHLPEYSGSQFDGHSAPLFDKDEDIERIWMQQESIIQWVGEDRFKTVEELQKRLRFVFGYATLDERNNVGTDFVIDPAVVNTPAPARQAPPARSPSVANTEQASPARRPAPTSVATPAPAPVESGDIQTDTDFLSQFDFED